MASIAASRLAQMIIDAIWERHRLVAFERNGLAEMIDREMYMTPEGPTLAQVEAAEIQRRRRSEGGTAPEPEHRCPSCGHRVTSPGLCPECRIEYLEKVHRGMAGYTGVD